MKKIVSCAFLGMTMASILSIQAQTSPWKGSALPTDGGTFYLYNVESGLWLQANHKVADDWTTRAQLDLYGLDIIVSPIETEGANSGQTFWQLDPRFGSNHSINAVRNQGYFDTGEDVSLWLISADDGTSGYDIPNLYTISSDNGSVQLGAELGETPDKTILSYDDVTNCHWQFVSKEERLADMEKATKSSPKDATWLIGDYDFNAWNQREDCWKVEFSRAGNNRYFGDCLVHGNNGFESWSNGTGAFYQEITGVPDGVYGLKLQGFYRDGPTSEIGNKYNQNSEIFRAFYFANEVNAPLMSICKNGVKEPIEEMFPAESHGYFLPGDGDPSMPYASRSFFEGYYWNDEILVTVTDGKLRIGVFKDEAVNDDWTVFDSFRLTYYGSDVDVSALVDNLQNLIDCVENYGGTKPQELLVAYATAKEAVSSTDAETLGDAIQNLYDQFFTAKLEACTTVSGVSGNITWKFNMTTGLLTLSGNGSMGDHPWTEYKETIKNVDIQSGITSISEEAFAGCYNLRDVIIPSTVTNIYLHAFWGCNLYSLTIGSGVKSIHTDAFNNYPQKVIWLCNTPPSGNLAGGINYVPNNQYSFSNQKVYSSLSSMFTVDGIKYVMVSPSDRTCEVIDCEYNDNAKHIQIGETVTYKNIKLTVLNLNDYAFYGNPFIKDVVISHNGNIGASAFENCDGITSIKLSNQGYVGDRAFYDCDGRRIQATINNNGSIGRWAFRSCGDLISVHIANNGSIESYAFSDCPNLYSVNIGNNGNIESDAFSDCPNLYSADININGSIGNYAFSGCTKLYAVTLNGVGTMGAWAFSGCSSLRSVAIPDATRVIYSYAFDGCSSLQEMTIPQSVTSIGNYAFRGCTALKDVTFADRTTALSLGSNGSNPMFSSCPLESVYIGGKITYNTDSSYGYSPFYRNTTLKSVTITDTETTIYPNEFYGCSALADVSIGDGVTTIGNWAFSGCSSLTNFSFGRGMKTIGEEAFSDCTAMTTIVSQASVPPTCGSQALDDINKWECELFVPTGYADAYAAADQWKEFFFVEEKDVEETYSTILAAEYGTWIVPVDAEIPEGFTFYTCENFNGGSLELVEATSIEANVPYIIQGTAGDTCTVTGIYDMSDNLTYGCLTGVYEDTQVTSGYVLQDGEEGLGFYRVGSSAITLTANHCYLNVTGSSAPMFRLGDATGVDRMMVEEQDGVLYDLYGRKVTEPNGAGIYIKNGKKVFVK